MSIQFTAFGHPEPAHRPRACRMGKGIRMVNDPRHVNWMESIRAQAFEHRPEKPLDGALSVYIAVYLLKPASAKKRKHPTVKPDLSNYVKAVEDALNGLIWTDDARIIRLTATKDYSETPRVEVLIIEEQEGKAE